MKVNVLCSLSSTSIKRRPDPLERRPDTPSVDTLVVKSPHRTLAGILGERPTVEEVGPMVEFHESEEVVDLRDWDSPGERFER